MASRRTRAASMALALAATVLFAGCLGGPYPPTVAPQPWTDTDAPVWIVHTTGCGLCEGWEPWATTTAITTDGHVVSFSYTPDSHSRERNDPRYDPTIRKTDPSGHVRTSASVADDHDALVPVARILAAHGVWHADDMPIHVQTHHLGVLTTKDRENVQGRLAEALAEAEDPGAPRYDCMDCAGHRVQVVERTTLDATLFASEHPQYGNIEAGDPWHRLDGQMHLLREWVAAAE